MAAPYGCEGAQTERIICVPCRCLVYCMIPQSSHKSGSHESLLFGWEDMHTGHACPLIKYTKVSPDVDIYFSCLVSLSLVLLRRRVRGRGPVRPYALFWVVANTAGDCASTGMSTGAGYP